MRGPWPGHNPVMDHASHPLLLRQVLGRALRRARLHQGRTVRDVATSAAVSAAHLSELERGHNEASSEVLAAVCTALDLQLAQVLLDAARQLHPDRHQGYVSIAHRRPVRMGRVHAAGCATRRTTWSTNPYSWASSAVNHRSRSASATIRS